jgi:hypothetical protein
VIQVQDDNEHKDEASAQVAPDASTIPANGRLKNGRFEKGFTGNAKGRPRKPERAWSNRQLTDDILLEANVEVPVTRNGKTEMVSMHRLIIRRINNQAANGNTRAQKMALDYMGRAQSGREAKHWKFHKDLARADRNAVRGSQ